MEAWSVGIDDASFVVQGGGPGNEAAYVFALLSLSQIIVLFLVCDQSLSGFTLTETLVLASYVVTAAMQCCDIDKAIVYLVLTSYFEAVMIISPFGLLCMFSMTSTSYFSAVLT